MENVIFRDNTFIGCYGPLLELSPTEDGKNIPVMENNTFCSLTADAIGYYKAAPSFMRQYAVGQAAEALARDVGNQTNRFVILE